MLKSMFTYVGRSLLWCLSASIGLAAMEAIGQGFELGASAYLPSHSEFFLRFSNTSLLLLITMLAVWIFLSIVPVWLGGVRQGIALLFMLLFFFLFAYLVIVLDILFTYVDKYALYWATLMRYFALFAFLAATSISLIVGKLTRNKKPALSPRYFLGFNLFLFLVAFVVYNRHLYFPDSDSLRFQIPALLIILLFSFGPAKLAKTTRWQSLLLALFLTVIHGSAVYARLQHQEAPQAPPVVTDQASQPAKRIILITVDTLRQDALGIYNGGKTQTPHMDALGRDSLIFTNAYTAAPWTYPSVASFLTGVSPRVHGMIDGKTALPVEIPTLAEAMQEAGYHSCAIGSNSLLLPRSGLDRGFTEYHWFPQQSLQVATFSSGLSHNLLRLGGLNRVVATDLTDLTIDWLQQHKEDNFFLWLHYFDPHIPYAPPEEWQPEALELKLMGNHFSDVRSARAGGIARTPKEREWIRALYQGDIGYTDAQIGRLTGALKLLELYDDSLIILTADHGEEFWDHGHFEHGHCLYNEVVQVPFLWKMPGNTTHESKTLPLSTQHIMPTLMELCNLELPDWHAHKSFASRLLGSEEESTIPPVFIGATLFHDPLEAVVFDTQKYLRSLNSSREEIYFLDEDPQEQQAVSTRDSETASRGRALLDEAREADAALREHLHLDDAHAQPIDLEDIRSLQALGYL